MLEQRNAPSTLARVAATLCATPIIGFAFTVWSVKQSMDSMSTHGVEDVATASRYIGQALTPAAVSVLLALVGFPIAMWCLVSRQQRAWWLISACAFAGMLLLWLTIHGTWLYMNPPAAAAR